MKRRSFLKGLLAGAASLVVAPIIGKVVAKTAVYSVEVLPRCLTAGEIAHRFTEFRKTVYISLTRRPPDKYVLFIDNKRVDPAMLFEFDGSEDELKNRVTGEVELERHPKL